VRLEVRDGHFTAGNERGVAREQPKRDQSAAHQFDDACGAALRGDWDGCAAEDAEQLLRPVAGEQEPRHDSQRRITERGYTSEHSVHHLSPVTNRPADYFMIDARQRPPPEPPDPS
jgi:hypothetical protein